MLGEDLLNALGRQQTTAFNILAIHKPRDGSVGDLIFLWQEKNAEHECDWDSGIGGDAAVGGN